MVALLTTVKLLDDLSDNSQITISLSSRAMRISNILTEHSAHLERNALQFSATREPALLNIYNERRATFQQNAQDLSALALGDEIQTQLDSLINQEAAAYVRMQENNLKETAPLEYPPLLRDTYKVSSLINEWSDQKLAEIRRETDLTRNLLQTQGIVLISIALVLAAIFTTLITRPLSQMKKAIQQLGKGEYRHKIAINGPKDLIELGDLIEWLRSRLESLEQQRTSFLRHVSHELKTPLAAMQESASLLNDGIVGVLNDEQMEILRIQSKSCLRLQALIDDLLRFNDGSFSVLQAMPEEIRVDKLIEQVVDAQELAIKQNDLNIRKSLTPCTIRANPEQIRVIIDNLFTNSIKFSPHGGVIHFTLKQVDHEVILGIQDQGPGIPEGEREKIFDAFYQAEPTAGVKNNGTGLGLAITREYARANGGTVTACDCAIGAHFQLKLPAINKDEQ